MEIRITDELVSQPYVDMTVRLMERFGVKVRLLQVATCHWQFLNNAAKTWKRAKRSTLCICVGGEVGRAAAHAHSSGADIQVAGRRVCGGRCLISFLLPGRRHHHRRHCDCGGKSKSTKAEDFGQPCTTAPAVAHQNIVRLCHDVGSVLPANYSAGHNISSCCRRDVDQKACKGTCGLQR